ncbi:MAG: hypothetical protein HYS04_14965 [Acidobacteria bacterium]|nr:hypothetical protein [Acidobacteriota bacterium]
MAGGCKIRIILWRVVAALALVGAFGIALVEASRSPKSQKPKPTPVQKRVPQAKSKPSAAAIERQIAQRWMRQMSLRQLVAQLVVITSYGEAPPKHSREFRNYTKLIRDTRVGGLIVINRVQNGFVRQAEPYAMAAFLNRMQRLARVPLLVGADFERGASMRVANTVKYPHLMAFGAAGDPQLTRRLGLATAREARALGVHWVFAPVADVNNNPDNPIINIRSFGQDPAAVSAHVRAFIEGAHSDPAARVLVTAKHFPGHGDTTVDSHLGLATVSAGRERLEKVELAPFRAAIAQGVDSIMTAHIALPAIEKEEIPATVSAAVLTGLLRDELKFGGLVVTDAMDMQGLSKQFDSGAAAARALEAGADVLLMPPDPEEAIRAVLAAVKNGTLTRKRIEQSALKVLMAKARLGLHRKRLVNLEEISDVLVSEESAALAQEVADRAVTLVKNTAKTVPIAQPANACLFLLSESRYGQQGRALMAEAARRAPGMRVTLLDPTVSAAELDRAAAGAGACPQVVVAAFVSVAAYRGKTALAGNYESFLRALIARGKPVTLISLGSPYLVRAFPGVGAFMTTYSTAPTSEIAALKALLGEIPITGKLPVTIPEPAQ